MKCETAILQNGEEITAFGKMLRDQNVKSYLEIGSKFGGSLWRLASFLSPGTRIVSVDLPQGDKSFKQSQGPLEECVAALAKRGFDTHLILGDSTDKRVVEEVRRLGPFDAIFVDANHTLPYVEKDWQNYRPMAKKLIAFHDIGFYRKGGLPPSKKPIDVPIFWSKIKTTLAVSEIRFDSCDNGIGVVWI